MKVILNLNVSNYIQGMITAHEVQTDTYIQVSIKYTIKNGFPIFRIYWLGIKKKLNRGEMLVQISER